METLEEIKLKLIKIQAEQIECEHIEDSLDEELEKLSQDALKHPEKCLSADEAVKELLYHE